ncbi:hypothetical protein LCGC14_0561990 [marine sediment metagenome]|uniref:Uncharacterized protein n=1 Tax=marine sediment metagenome TaxID=412755 RepID=A0A0F9S5H0_9ZZZZ
MSCQGCAFLAKQLAEIEDVARTEATLAAAKMSKGDIGRAEYGFAHAQLDMGNTILNILGRPEVVLKKSRMGGLFKGLFGE